LFTSRRDWHQDDRARPLVRQYLLALDSVVECHPELQGCVVGCVDCGLRFLTDPRNVGRQDLRCPFGCRADHRRKCSQQRSSAYYRTAVGKQKKKLLNARRSDPSRSGVGASSASGAPASAASVSLPEELPSLGELPRAGVVLDEATLTKSRLLPYVRLVVNLIEGLQLGVQEVLQRLRRNLRQHRMGWRRRADYGGDDLLRHPP
jgi:hypothetical protein